MNIKRFFLSPIYKLKYWNSSIAFGAFISPDSLLGNNINIGRNSFIINSFLENKITVGRESGINHSKLKNNTAVYSHCSLLNVELDQYTYVSSFSTIGNSVIGKFCSIGSYLICGMGTHPTNLLSTHPSFFSTQKQCGMSFTKTDSFQEYKNISIGHDVWIGARVFINDGIRIGNGAIIGAGAVIVKDVPDYAIVGGTPAKIIRFRFTDDIINELLKIQWWHWPEDRLSKAQSYFINENIHEFIEAVNQDKI